MAKIVVFVRRFFDLKDEKRKHASRLMCTQELLPCAPRFEHGVGFTENVFRQFQRSRRLCFNPQVSNASLLPQAERDGRRQFSMCVVCSERI